MGAPVPGLSLAIPGFLAGLAVGSFLATLVVRAPQGLPLSGRSRCDHCGAALAIPDLLPLLSFLLRRGRCRRCGAPIDPVHPLLEVLGALVGALSLGLLGLPLGLAGALLGWTLLALAALDLRHFWLPDWLTLPLLAGGLAATLLLHPARLPTQFAAAGLAGLTLWLVRALFARLRGREGLGLGDVKLAAGLGAWLSPALLPPLLLLAALAGLALAAAVRLGRGQHGRQGRWPIVPFGACLAVAAWPTWLASAATVGPEGIGQPVRLQAERLAKPTAEGQQHGQRRNKNVKLRAQGTGGLGEAESARRSPAGKGKWANA